MWLIVREISTIYKEYEEQTGLFAPSPIRMFAVLVILYQTDTERSEVRYFVPIMSQFVPTFKFNVLFSSIRNCGSITLIKYILDGGFVKQFLFDKESQSIIRSNGFQQDQNRNEGNFFRKLLHIKLHQRRNYDIFWPFILKNAMKKKLRWWFFTGTTQILRKEKVGGLFTKGAYQIRDFYRSSPLDDSLVL